MKTCVLSVLLLMSALCAWAFNEPVVQEGPLTALITGPAAVHEVETPVVYEAVVSNTGTEPVSGMLYIEVIDQWRIKGPDSYEFSLSPGASQSIPFTAIAGAGTYNAWYPIHVRAVFEHDSRERVAHPILMVRTDLAAPPRPTPGLPWTPMTVPENGRRSLSRLPVHRAFVEVFGEAPVMLPVGWRGIEPRTRAVLHTPGVIALPDPKRALFAHPPWHEGRAGVLVIEFPLALPDSAPLRFDCFIAMQEHMAGEPPSDGVTFRVYAAPLYAPDGERGALLLETHTDANAWMPVSADLSAYAGQQIRLQLETHPGPHHDTTCDRALWGDPVIVAGTPAPARPPSDVPPVNLGTVANGDSRYMVQVTLGRRGLLDSRVDFAGENGILSFDGFSITVLDDTLEKADGISELLAVEDESDTERCRIRHRFRGRSGTYDLVGELYLVEGYQALRAAFHIENAPEAQPWLYTVIEDSATGAWNRRARHVYAGMGNVLRNPEAFTLHFDGHQMATSFVGFDFEDGSSLVQAVDAPPSRLTVVPDSGLYTLHAPIMPVFTFIPADDVWQGVRVWRNINGLEAAPGVERLAGRFVFDLWWGHYGESADALTQAFRYGLTNSVVVWHNWQRWGYDYRLPDILPPNPDYGTEEDFVRLAHTCRDHDVIFAPHDNYIDFYPDAEGFTYERIAFNPDGQPIWAWLNEFRKAQSFRWRVDALGPFLERNVRALHALAHPNGYFIDVWSSIGPYESWTRDGQLHDRLLHRRVWGEAFNWIRETLGDNAPQISESGHDQLIGYLDGAQANHLRVDADPPPGAEPWMVWPVRCEAAERIPWSDMAHHDRFILHGAGYENRYRAGLRSDLHGIYSDDYIATEVLTGRPCMAAHPFDRDVIRKYYLTNCLMKRLAMQRIATVAFDGDNLHRQHVRWEGVGDIRVNRGETSWQVSERDLPQYGFYADLGDVSGAIEYKDGVIVEWSKSPEAWYVNARPVTPRGLPVSVSLESLNLVSDRSFAVELRWEVAGPIEEDLTIYVHFMDAQGKIAFQADHRPDKPTSRWIGTETSVGHGTIPAYFQAGDMIPLFVGMWLPGDGHRPLQDAIHGNASVLLGQVRLDGANDSITGLTLSPTPPERDAWLARMNPQGIPVDFDGIVTEGACRVVRDGDSLLLIPLPDSPRFNVHLDLSRLPFDVPAPTHIEYESMDGERTRLPLDVSNGLVHIKCAPDIFGYRLIAHEDNDS